MVLLRPPSCHRAQPAAKIMLFCRLAKPIVCFSFASDAEALCCRWFASAGLPLVLQACGKACRAARHGMAAGETSCHSGRFALPHGPYCIAVWPVLHCHTARFSTSCRPAGCGGMLQAAVRGGLLMCCGHTPCCPLRSACGGAGRVGALFFTILQAKKH